jgi:cell division protein FtsB
MTATPKPPAKAPAPRKRPSRPFSVQVMFTAILAIALILAINFSSRIAATQPLQQTYDEVTDEIARLRQEQAELIIERDYVRGDAYVEQWARDEGKLVRPGEVLIVPVPSSEDVAVTEDEAQFIEVETSPPPPAAWMVWWELFFDSPPPDF